MMSFANTFGAGAPALVHPLYFTESRDWTAPCPGRLVIRMIGGGGGGPGNVGYRGSGVQKSTGGTGAAWGLNVFDINEGDVVSVEIGAGGAKGVNLGGSGGTSPQNASHNGQDGGPTILRINAQERMRAPGGIGGKMNSTIPNAETALPSGVLIGERGCATHPADHSICAGGTVALAGVNVNDPQGLRVYPHGLLNLVHWGFDSHYLGLLGRNPGILPQENSSHPLMGITGFGIGGGIFEAPNRSRGPGLGGGGSSMAGSVGGGNGYAFAQFFAEV